MDGADEEHPQTQLRAFESTTKVLSGTQAELDTARENLHKKLDEVSGESALALAYLFHAGSNLGTPRLYGTAILPIFWLYQFAVITSV